MRVSLVILFGLTAVVPAQSFMIQSHEIPLVVNTYGQFAQNATMFQWFPFDSTRTHWDLTGFQQGFLTRVGLRSYMEGIPPAPDSMDDDAPAPDVCEFDTLGNGTRQTSYLYKTQFGLYFDGMDVTQATIRIIGNYRPDGHVYSTPMYHGSGWLSAAQWVYEILPGSGIFLIATEQHVKKIVARGKVKVPMSGEYFWPCLVIQDQMTYTDNMGSMDSRWIYEWVVPGHFLGGNGIAAAMSQSGAASNFINVEQLFQMSSASIPGWDVIPPTFSDASVIADTGYVGPYNLHVNITDDSAVGAESLFYRVDGAAWQSVGSDSSSGSEYHFTIPEVTSPAQVDYYFWAKDEFSVTDSIDCWTTWPVCSPESTFIRFNVTAGGVGSRSQLQPGDHCFSIAPNPFRTRTRFLLARYGASEATVRIYSVAGGLVQTIELVQGTGGLVADWDGRDAQGRSLSAGAYLYRASAPGWSETGKLLLQD